MCQQNHTKFLGSRHQRVRETGRNARASEQMFRWVSSEWIQRAVRSGLLIRIDKSNFCCDCTRRWIDYKRRGKGINLEGISYSGMCDLSYLVVSDDPFWLQRYMIFLIRSKQDKTSSTKYCVSVFIAYFLHESTVLKSDFPYSIYRK